MSKDFLRGMGSIDLTPNAKQNHLKFSRFPSSIEEAFKKDQEAIGKDMWNAIKIIKSKYPEIK